jgi:hypothetical protein
MSGKIEHVQVIMRFSGGVGRQRKKAAIGCAQFCDLASIRA